MASTTALLGDGTKDNVIEKNNTTLLDEYEDSTHNLEKRLGKRGMSIFW